jgi:hypothetical protein
LTEALRDELGITKLPNTLDQRKEVTFSPEGDQIREFLGEDIVKNILTCHEEDYRFFEELTH